MNVFELQKEFVKTLIRDTIETYPGQWRLVHEAIQNSHDAIHTNDKIKRGRISIELFVGTNKIVIQDNGVGIPISKFDTIFQLGGGDKKQSVFKKLLKGSQGVGIKACLFTSNYFNVETVHGDQKWKFEATDFYKFGDDAFKGELKAPSTQQTRESSGTKMTYSLKDYTVADFLNEVIAEYCDDTQREEGIADERELKRAVETYFRTKTYIGCVQRLLKLNPALKPIDVEVQLNFDFPSVAQHEKLKIEKCVFISESDHHGKIIKHQFPGSYLDTLEIHGELEKGLQAEKVFSNFEAILENPPDSNIKKVLIQKFNKDQAKRLLYRTKREPATNDLILEENPVATLKHKRVLDILNGIYVVVAQRPYMTRYFHIGPKQLLSVNGLPTNIALNPPRGALAYLNNIHIILDVDTTLGFGKRNIPGRTKGIIDSFFADIWSMLRRVTPAIVGAREGKDPTDVKDWNKEEEYENFKSKDNLLKELPLFFKNTPKEEQEVVALFFELLGRKIIQGYFPFRVGGSQANYDALFLIAPGEERVPKNFKWRDLKTIEFKFHLSEIINDFTEEIKFLDGIDLVVCWDNDCIEDTSEYNISSLERDGIEPLPSATLRIQKSTKSCQVLVLKDFISKLQLAAP